MNNIFYVMSVGTRVCPKKALISYGGGEMERCPNSCYFLVEDENGKKLIVSGSGKSEGYESSIQKDALKRYMELEIQGKQRRHKFCTILNDCNGTDELPKFGKGTFPFYVMK